MAKQLLIIDTSLFTAYIIHSQQWRIYFISIPARMHKNSGVVKVLYEQFKKVAVTGADPEGWHQVEAATPVLDGLITIRQ